MFQPPCKERLKRPGANESTGHEVEARVVIGNDSVVTTDSHVERSDRYECLIEASETGVQFQRPTRHSFRALAKIGDDV